MSRQVNNINTCARFSNISEVQSLYLEFGHDATIAAAMAAMDLNRYISMHLALDSISYIHPQRRTPTVFRRTTPAPKVPNIVSDSLCCPDDLGKFHL